MLMFALRLHREAHNSLGEANDHLTLGDLYISTGRLMEAMTALQRALDLFEQIVENLGKAYTLQFLGKLYLASDQFQTAKDAFSQAFNFHEKIHKYTTGALWDLRHLFNLYIKLSRDEDAADALQKFIECLCRTRYMHNLANELQCLGKVYI